MRHRSSDVHRIPDRVDPKGADAGGSVNHIRRHYVSARQPMLQSAVGVEMSLPGEWCGYLTLDAFGGKLARATDASFLMEWVMRITTAGLSGVQRTVHRSRLVLDSAVRCFRFVPWQSCIGATHCFRSLVSTEISFAIWKMSTSNFPYA